jgi:hypothetical protein
MLKVLIVTAVLAFAVTVRAEVVDVESEYGGVIPPGPPPTHGNCFLFENFTSFPNNNFEVANCPGNIFVENGTLAVRMTQMCPFTTMSSLQALSSGYVETSLKIGGQGPNYNGVVYAFYLQSDDLSNGGVDEMDFEWLGNPKWFNQVQTNFFVNGVGAALNEQYFFETVSDGSFNKYAFRFDSNMIEYFINDELVRTVHRHTNKSFRIKSSVWDGSSVSAWAGTVNWSSPAVNNFKLNIEYILACQE